MALIKHVVGEDGTGIDIEMTPEEEAEFLASLPVLVEPVPASITRRQCARQMLAMGLITAPEALEMTRSGIPPNLVAAMIAGLDPADAVLVEIDFAADTYVRANPLLVSLMQGTGADDAAIDQFFRDAAAL
jgi:hypothetical protein